MAKKILIVDDDADLRTLLKTTLGSRRAGEPYEVLTAANGKEALTQLKTIKPDLIILDILMPGMDGTQLGQILQESPQTQHIPLVFLTALKKKTEEKTNSVETGGHVIFAKPFSPEVLLKKIDEIFTKQKTSF